VQPQIDGQLLGAPVVPAGAFGDGNPADQWQQFTFSWNSGSNSSASLILHDFTGTSEGNDFGLDNIQVAGTPSTPLPASLLPGSAGILAVLLYGWRRSQLA
jgi:hypothetical protein